MEDQENISQPILYLLQKNKQINASFFLETQLLFDCQFIKKKFNIILSYEHIQYISYLLKYTYYVKNRLNQPEKYQQFIRKNIFQYYISNKMKIKLYDYSQMCSKLLHYQLIDCLHIHYYLIYNQFASTAYVNKLIENKKKINRRMHAVSFQSRKANDRYSSIKSTLKNKKQSQLIRENSFQSLKTQLSYILGVTKQIKQNQQKEYIQYKIKTQPQYQIRTQATKINENSGILHTFLNQDKENFNKSYKIIRKNKNTSDLYQQAKNHHQKVSQNQHFNSGNIKPPFFVRQNISNYQRCHKVIQLLKQSHQIYNQQKNTSHMFDSVRNQINGYQKSNLVRKNERYKTEQYQNEQRFEFVIKKSGKQSLILNERRSAQFNILNEDLNELKLQKKHKNKLFYKFKSIKNSESNKVTYKNQYQQFLKSRIQRQKNFI